MSIACDVLIALSLSFGGMCAETDQTSAPSLPEDEKRVWTTLPPVPEPIPEAPSFPPVIIKQALPQLPPITVPPPAPSVTPLVVATPPPVQPSPLRLALEAAFSNANRAGIQSVGGEPLPAPGTPVPGGFIPASFSPPGDALALQPETTQKRYDAASTESGLPVDNARILAADRYISGILETGLNSQLDSVAGGSAIIQVSRDVFGYHGRFILIPKGSRLICDYQSPGRQGDTRVAFSCGRIILGEHRAEILQLSATAGDVQGRAGVSGEVDNRFWERYGTAFLLTGLSTSVRFATALASSNSENSPLGNVADKGSEELSQKLGEITASVLEQTVNLAPIVTLAQGTRVQIRPAKDWYIREIGKEQ
jgi:type IV secretion system protein VirB10